MWREKLIIVLRIADALENSQKALAHWQLLYTGIEHCRIIFLEIKRHELPCPNFLFAVSFCAYT